MLMWVSCSGPGFFTPTELTLLATQTLWGGLAVFNSQGSFSQLLNNDACFQHTLVLLGHPGMQEAMAPPLHTNNFPQTPWLPAGPLDFKQSQVYFLIPELKEAGELFW